MGISMRVGQRTLREFWVQPPGTTWMAPEWQELLLVIDRDEVLAANLPNAQPTSAVRVMALEIPGGAARPVEYDSARGWHRVNLDGVKSIGPPRADESRADQPSNDGIQRVALRLSNPTDGEKVARLMFEKTSAEFRGQIGTPITGVSAILRNRDGHPIGIPVQLSKNWHNDSQGGVYAEPWFHGISLVRLPPRSQTQLELSMLYGHWGGVPAASHSQLCLIGWGNSQLWDQSAIGSWGESICYDPDQVQRDCTIIDVRPLMVRSMKDGKPWGWTTNVGGGDFFRLFDPAGEHLSHRSMRTTYLRQGPCLTEVTRAGLIGENITHSETISLARGDDIVRGIYQIRMDVNQATDFSRFVIFQIGADTYSSPGEQKMAVGNENGLLREWDTQWGGDRYRIEPIEGTGRIPWASLHEATPRKGDRGGASANRGVVIRQ